MKEDQLNIIILLFTPDLNEVLIVKDPNSGRGKPVICADADTPDDITKFMKQEFGYVTSDKFIDFVGTVKFGDTEVAVLHHLGNQMIKRKLRLKDTDYTWEPVNKLMTGDNSPSLVHLVPLAMMKMAGEVKGFSLEVEPPFFE